MPQSRISRLGRGWACGALRKPHPFKQMQFDYSSTLTFTVVE